MEKLQCLSWISFLWDQARGKFAENASSSIDLPYDIFVDIFTRLPAESVVQNGVYKSLRSLTATPHFVDMHLRRAVPIICFQYYTFPTFRPPKTIFDADISFTDDKSKKITRERFKMDSSSFAFSGRGSMPFLYGSYRGLLLFINVYEDFVLHILNPVTRSQAIVVAPTCCFRGIYFHRASAEYRVLYGYVEGECWKYIVLSLKTGSSRKIGSSSLALGNHTLPTVFNGALHWIVNDDACREFFGLSPHCSKSVVKFNMDSEEFSTMPHPGGQCNLRMSHHKVMELMEFDGHLCLCDVSSGKEIVIWILEDYARQLWARRHVVIIEPVKQFCTVPGGCNCDLDDYVQPIHIYGNDLLVRMSHSDLFLCNLSSGAIRRVGKRCSNPDYCVSPVAYTKSLVSLNTDGILYLSS